MTLLEFQFWHFPTIFVLSKVTCLVTLFNRKLQVFKYSPKLTIFGIFSELLSTQNVNVARYARNVEWDFFCDFQTLCDLGPFSALICESAFDNICVFSYPSRKTLTLYLGVVIVFDMYRLLFYPIWMLCDALGIKRNALKNTSKCTIFSVFMGTWTHCAKTSIFVQKFNWAKSRPIFWT